LVEWVARARRVLEGAGMSVSESRARYKTLTGGSVGEVRVTGYSRDGLLKVSVSLREGEDGLRVSVLARGEASRESLAEHLEALGANIDYNEGERLYGVLKRVDPGDVEDVLRSILEA